jgi:hypothetical protein
MVCINHSFSLGNINFNSYYLFLYEQLNIIFRSIFQFVFQDILNKGKKVKIFLLQTMEAHRVVRGCQPYAPATLYPQVSLFL